MILISDTSVLINYVNIYRIHVKERVMHFFFFSSRRRHTRFDCDWSSDVCSSDLETMPACGGAPGPTSSRVTTTSTAAAPPQAGMVSPGSNAAASLTVDRAAAG